jgi:23S rRNA-/tRNA-specific pseudouridylate synthase
MFSPIMSSELVTVDQPLDCLSRKTGLQWISKKGKAATTDFECLSFNGKSSVVKCMPKTGRTHQIRVHLQVSIH